MQHWGVRQFKFRQFKFLNELKRPKIKKKTDIFEQNENIVCKSDLYLQRFFLFLKNLKCFRRYS